MQAGTVVWWTGHAWWPGRLRYGLAAKLQVYFAEWLAGYDIMEVKDYGLGDWDTRKGPEWYRTRCLPGACGPNGSWTREGSRDRVGVVTWQVLPWEGSGKPVCVRLGKPRSEYPLTHPFNLPTHVGGPISPHILQDSQGWAELGSLYPL